MLEKRVKTAEKRRVSAQTRSEERERCLEAHIGHYSNIRAVVTAPPIFFRTGGSFASDNQEPCPGSNARQRNMVRSRASCNIELGTLHIPLLIDVDG